MNPLSKITEILCAFVIAIFLLTMVAINLPEHPLQPIAHNATTTLETKTATTTLEIPTGTGSTTPPKKAAARATTTPLSHTLTAPIPPQSALIIPTSIDANSIARSATVNILCAASANSPVGSITASGIIIDPRGVILTNAHVGEYFLLNNYPVASSTTCIIRIGSPARTSYSAELLYLPPQWIADNAAKITTAVPTGTGENDYALLRITGSLNSTPLPDHFPFLIPDIAGIHLATGEPLVITSYPAGFLGGSSVLNDLYLASAKSVIGEIFTFETETPDLISTGGTVVAQRGSSGGAVVSAQDVTLVGIAVTSSDAATTDLRDLRAITLSHIHRSMLRSSGLSLAGYLSSDLTEIAHTFNTAIAPTLTAALVQELEK